ncbi:dna large subunit, partial [Cystoisospora suis]
FSLFLSFSSDRERQQWFIRQECRLFLYRLDELMRSHPEATGVASEDLPFNQFLQREGLEYDFV